MPYCSKLYFQLLAVLLMFSSGAWAQTFLEIPVKLEIEKGDLSEVVVKVKKDGKDAFTQSGASKMRFKLDFNKKYTLVFTKPGYITKTIEINTSAPAARISNGFEPYKIGVKLFLQNAENMVVYNQPVAQIKYDANIDEFNFDTDYSKSILSAISRDNEEEKPAPEQPAPSAPKAEPVSGAESAPAPTPAPAPAPEPPRPVAATPAVSEETAANHSAAASSGSELPQPPAPAPAAPVPVPAPAPAPVIAQEATTPPAPAAAAEQPATAPATGSESPKKTAVAASGETSPSSKPASAGEDKPARKANAAAGEDNRRTASAGSGSDKPIVKAIQKEGADTAPAAISTSSSTEAPPPAPQFTEDNKVTREDIVEKNRVITKIRVSKNGVTTEYSRVNYNWGGQFYFRNNTQSISENLFVQWTGVR
ncbi:MAG: hypothetical protein U0Y08_00470 [Bacteroidia bacterium]